MSRVLPIYCLTAVVAFSANAEEKVKLPGAAPVFAVVCRIDRERGIVWVKAPKRGDAGDPVAEISWSGKENRAVSGDGGGLDGCRLAMRLKAGDVVLLATAGSVDASWLKPLKADAVILLGRGNEGNAPTPDEDDLSPLEREVHELINAERKKGNLPPLAIDAKLLKAARSHSRNMAAKAKLAHTLDGKGPAERLRDLGYEFRTMGENVAFGQATPKEALASWLGSPPHKADLLNRDFVATGIGFAVAADGAVYWTQLFAAPLEK